MTSPSLSIVVPLYNEQSNVAPLCAAIDNALARYDGNWQVILVDDGSSDTTARHVRHCQLRYGQRFRFLQLQRNFGQTAAMQAGIDASDTELIATMDGDLQNDPTDIPRLVEELLTRDLDILQGWRKDRQDDFFSRKIPSRIANTLIGRISGVKLNDYGCSLKVYRAAVLKQIKLYGEMHRFIPIWMATVCPPHRIGQSPVHHSPRANGRSKYGLSRTFRVVVDLLAVFFFLKYRARPGHFFGSIGLFLGALGALMLTYLGVIKYIGGEDIGGRPMLLIGSFLVIASLQFLTTGVLSEILSRVFFQTTNVKSYTLRTPLTGSFPADSDGNTITEEPAVDDANSAEVPAYR